MNVVEVVEMSAHVGDSLVAKDAEVPGNGNSLRNAAALEVVGKI